MTSSTTSARPTSASVPSEGRAALAAADVVTAGHGTQEQVRPGLGTLSTGGPRGGTVPRMSRTSALLAAAAALLLILAGGNPPLSREFGFRGDDDPIAPLAVSVDFLTWDFGRLDGDFQTATIVNLLLFFVLVTILGGLVGRARPLAAFIGGWGAAMLAAAFATGFARQVLDQRFSAGFGTGRPSRLTSFALGAQIGAGAAFWFGWVVGIAVLAGSLMGRRTIVEPKKAKAGAPASYAPAAGGPGQSWTGPSAPGGQGEGTAGTGWAPAPSAQPAGTPEPAQSPFTNGPPSGAPGPSTAPPESSGPVIGAPPERTRPVGPDDPTRAS